MNLANFFMGLLLVLTVATKVAACDCGYNGSFMRVAREADAVVLVKIIRHKNVQKSYGHTIMLAMEAEIIKIYKGKITKNIVTVWGDDGIMCRPYVMEFTIGNKYIMALDNLPSNAKIIAAPEYYVSVCGEYWLSVNEKTGLVYGDIDSLIRLSSVNTLQGFEAEFRRKVL